MTDSQKHETRYKSKVTWYITRNHSIVLVILEDEKNLWNTNWKGKISNRQ